MEMNNNQKGINLTCHAFIWCMNISFVISMSQLYEYQFFHYAAVFLDVIAVLFLIYHYIIARGLQIKTATFSAIAVAVGIISYISSDGPTILKLILFILAIQAVGERRILSYFYSSLILAFIIVMISSFAGLTTLTYYSRFKQAYSFGFQNPNTVPVVLFAIMSGVNIAHEKTLKFKHIILELIVMLIFYYFCKGRTAFYICILTCVLLIFKNPLQYTKILKIISWPFQFLFLILAAFSYYVTIMYRAGDSNWQKLNLLLSGRLFAWQGYYSRYGISVFGNKLSTEYYGALDNAYLQLIIKYGLIAFILYAVIFIVISRYAWKNNRWVLFIMIISTEFYFLAEFGPMIVNFCPVILCFGCMLNKDEAIEDEEAVTTFTWHGKKLF